MGAPSVASPSGVASSAQLPDLVPAPPYELAIGASDAGTPVIDPNTPEPVIVLATRAANRGGYALDILGTPSATPLVMDASQCIEWSTRQGCVARQRVGWLRLHAPHWHWHFDDFALYELRQLGTDGTPDFSSAGLVGQGTKASFCLEDSARDGGQPSTEAPQLYVTCQGVLQGISAGWADIYDSGLPGQWVPIAGVPDGRYAVVITLNPERTLLESDYSNNTSWTVVDLADNGQTVTVPA